MEQNDWPSWLRQIWPNWLENIGYPSPGVGDLEDLSFNLGVGEGGKWIGFINPGWFYHDNSEQYNYVQIGTVTVTGAVGSGSIVADVSFRPSWGPILVNGADGTPYRQHHNSYYPAMPLSWSAGSSGLYYASVPSSSILVGMRDLTNLQLGSVASTGLIISSKLYFYDQDNNRVYVKPADSTNIELWADIIYTTPRLRFREIVIDEGGGVTASYNQIEDVSIIRGSQTYTSTGYHASGFLTHTLSGVSTGDWVVMDYWISKSYTMFGHNHLYYYVGGSSGSAFSDTLSLYHETSIPDILPSISINDAVSGTFNVNPLHSQAYRAGYLFHAVPGSSLINYWTPGTLKAYLDKDTVCAVWGETLKLFVMAREENDLPLPYYPIMVVTTGGSAIMQMPSNGRTDGRGELHYIIVPTIGASAVNVSITLGSLSSSVSATIVGSGSMIDIDKWIDGHVNILVTNERSRRGAFRVFTNACNLDGIPRDTSEDNINIKSQLASEFYDDTDKTWTKSVDVGSSLGIPNVAGVSEIGYVPQPNDALFGSSADAQSKIIRSDI